MFLHDAPHCALEELIIQASSNTPPGNFTELTRNETSGQDFGNNLLMITGSEQGLAEILGSLKIPGTVG